MRLNEKAAVFALGAIGYPILELLYRGRTHASMGFAGGVCFSAIYRIHRGGGPFLLRCARCALAVTGVELAVGLVVNRWLRLGVWDYSHRRFNILGQVCLAYSCLWFGLAALAAPLCRGIALYFSRPMAYNLQIARAKPARGKKEWAQCLQKSVLFKGMSGSTTKTL